MEFPGSGPAPREPSAGTEAWLYLGGNHEGGRGLIGHGFLSPDSRAPGGRTPYRGTPDQPTSEEDAGEAPGFARVDFDLLLAPGDQVPVAELRAALPQVPWAIPGSGGFLPPADVRVLRRLWSAHLGMPADPLAPAPGTMDGSFLATRHVNRYEHDADARRVCLAFHGDACAACGTVPSRRYGSAGQDVLQVHHLIPGPDLAEGYELDPVSDLVPLCPTCHAVAHSRVPVPYTPAEVRRLLAAEDAPAGWLAAAPPDAEPFRATALTDQQQQALEDAAKLRGLR